MQPLYVYSGPYGRREIEESLKTLNQQTKLFYGPFCTCFCNGSRFKQVLARGLYLISLIDWDVTKVVFFCVFPFLFGLNALYASCILLLLGVLLQAFLIQLLLLIKVLLSKFTLSPKMCPKTNKVNLRLYTSSSLALEKNIVINENYK